MSISMTEGSPRGRESTDESARFRFIDLFAGIGGMRTAFERVGGRCVFACEINAFSRTTYEANFGRDAEIAGDIRSVVPHAVPDHDVLVAGFPCQPFSIAGVSRRKSLQRAHGLACADQGTLFHDIAAILAAKRPAAFVLENVPNLEFHDRGRTLETIRAALAGPLGGGSLEYAIEHRRIDGRRFTPQRRVRLYIVGLRRDSVTDGGSAPFPWNSMSTDGSVPDPVLTSVLHRTDGTEPVILGDGDRFFDHTSRSVPDRYTLSPVLWAYLQEYAAKHRRAGNGFGYGLVGPDDVARTLSARYGKDGAEILIRQGEGQRPRRLTPRECARLMGFPDSFQIPVSNRQAYRQFGNSVIVPAVETVARMVAPMVA